MEVNAQMRTVASFAPQQVNNIIKRVFDAIPSGKTGSLFMELQALDIMARIGHRLCQELVKELDDKAFREEADDVPG